MVDSDGAGGAAGAQGYVTLLAAALLHFLPTEVEQRARTLFLRMPALVQAGAICGLVYGLVIVAAAPRPFVYFQF
jgi:hypothetical protein